MWFITFILINLRYRLARTLLTAGGIAVAIGTAVVLLGVSHDFEQSAHDSLSNGGVEILVVQEGVLDQLSSDLDATLSDRIRKLPGVDGVSPGLLEIIDYKKTGEDPADSNVISILVQGWEPDTFLFDEMEFLEGDHYTSDDKKVVLLGKTLAQNIDKGVGDTVRIQREAFEVVGIYENASSFESGGMILPLTQLQRAMVRGNYVTGFSLRVDHSSGETDMIERVCDRLNSLTDENGELLRRLPKAWPGSLR